MKRIISLLLACTNIGFCSLSYAQTAGAAKETAIYVAPYGNDLNDGTKDAPFATISRAKEEVRSLNDDMQGDITVYLREGTYRPEKTLEFSEEDSGTNGYYVTYKAYPDETATISGGISVTDWKQQGDLWYASAEGVERAGQLYVNNRRAQRARSKELIPIGKFFSDNNSQWKYDGILVNDKKYAEYINPEDIQLHFGGRGWKSYLFNVEDAKAAGNTTKLYMSRRAFNHAADTERAANWYPVQQWHCFWLENAFEELDEPANFIITEKKKEYIICQELTRI